MLSYSRNKEKYDKRRLMLDADKGGTTLSNWSAAKIRGDAPASINVTLAFLGMECISDTFLTESDLNHVGI